MGMDMLKLLLFVYSVQSAAVINKKDGFGEENFLAEKVDVPRIHQGSGKIHSISGVKKQEPRHDAGELNDLLKKVFNKFLTKDYDSTSAPSGKNVKFGSDGKAYVNKQLIPQYKRVVNENNNKKQDDVSIEEISNSVSHLLDSLSKQKAEKDEFKFQSVQQRDQTEKKSKDDDFEKFKKKFYQNFLGDHDDKQVNSQRSANGPDLVFNGKDNHVDGGSNGKRERLNKLYDELRSETKEHVAEEQKQNKKERIELVQKDVLDLLNALQKREILTYHDGKFALAEDNRPEIIFNGKDHHSTSNNKKDSSKLETVKLLVEQLRDLEQRKKEKLAKKEEKQRIGDDSLKNMEKVFIEAFKKGIEKKKLAEKKREQESKKSSGSLREVLVDLMGKLDEQINDEKARVTADEKQISQLERQGTSDEASSSSPSKTSLDDELDNILNGLTVSKKNAVKRNWGSDPETEKALKGFNVQKKPGRP